MTLDHLARESADIFVKRFGRSPRWIAAAPGRVNLIGEHTDYNGGFVLPMAIDRYLVVAGDVLAESGFSRFFSTTLGSDVALPIGQNEPPQGNCWSNYVRGVLAGFAQNAIVVPALEGVIHSAVPPGGGLSSSAALEVATATLCEAAAGISLPPIVKALICQRAEHQYAGVPCGIMDQFASVMAEADRLLLIDCKSQAIRNVTFADPEVSVLIMNSNVQRELAAGEYAERRRQCEAAAQTLGVERLRDVTSAELAAASDMLDPTLFPRVRHVVTENERTLQTAEAVGRADWTEVGRLMYESHRSLRDDYEVSCDELDLLVELAGSLGESAGILGSRMTGGGFGGCTVSLVKSDQVEQVSQTIAAAYRAHTGIEAEIFATRPARGAQLIEIA